MKSILDNDINFLSDYEYYDEADFETFITSFFSTDEYRRYLRLEDKKNRINFLREQKFLLLTLTYLIVKYLEHNELYGVYLYTFLNEQVIVNFKDSIHDLFSKKLGSSVLIESILKVIALDLTDDEHLATLSMKLEVFYGSFETPLTQFINRFGIDLIHMQGLRITDYTVKGEQLELRFREFKS